MSTPAVTPSEEDLTAAILAIKATHPNHGIKKVLADVISSNPTWTVSEKRVKKLMQARGLVQTSHLVRSGIEDDPSVPVSSLDTGLDVKKLTSAIEVGWRCNSDLLSLNPKPNDKISIFQNCKNISRLA